MDTLMYCKAGGTRAYDWRWLWETYSTCSYPPDGRSYRACFLLPFFRTVK